MTVADARRELREQARTIASVHRSVVDAWQAGPGQVQRPERKQWVKHAGEWQNLQAQDWDWFYALTDAEQGRLRRTWFAADGNLDAMTLDELAAIMGTDDTRAAALEWLEETRIIDAAEAMTAGRPIVADYYGGMDVDALFDSPYSVHAVYSTDPETAEAHVRWIDSGGNRRYHDDGVNPVEQYAMARALEDEARQEANRLRENAIGRMLAQGMSVIDISHALGISRQAANDQARKIRGAQRAS